MKMIDILTRNAVMDIGTERETAIIQFQKE